MFFQMVFVFWFVFYFVLAAMSFCNGFCICRLQFMRHLSNVKILKQTCFQDFVFSNVCMCVFYPLINFILSLPKPAKLKLTHINTQLSTIIPSLCRIDMYLNFLEKVSKRYIYQTKSDYWVLYLASCSDQFLMLQQKK